MCLAGDGKDGRWIRSWNREPLSTPSLDLDMDMANPGAWRCTDGCFPNGRREAWWGAVGRVVFNANDAMVNTRFTRIRTWR